MSESSGDTTPLLSNEDIDSTPVYPIIHMIRQDMMHFIDTPLSYETLTAPDLTYTLIRPLEDKYLNIQRKGNYSIVFCFLLNRVHFLRDQNLVTAPLSRSRASLCEILAIRILREYGDKTLELAIVTTTSWRVYSGGDEDVLKQTRDTMGVDEVEEQVGNAIELAIIGKAKRFIKSSTCQKVIDGIWSGKCVYQAQSSHSILSDTYKRTPIHFYDPHKAPLLDHYRLKVPAVRSVLEYVNFIILFILFVLTLELSELNRLTFVEAAFMFYAFGFSLEKVAAMQEHGMRVYFTGTWNGFDLALIAIFGSYASLRIYGLQYDNPWARSSGIDCLALAACLIFPRLAFVTLKNNLMVLSLRAMIIQFVILMLIAAFCFAGFLYALWTLARTDVGYSAGDIFWWMADLWFGLDATGFALASTFHPYFGPILIIAYACLSNTLLLTVLVSILSHTFSIISEDAAAEAMFRRAVLTIEGVKADYLFSYQPPINVFALMIMLPASYILSPRWFHKFNVFMIRATNLPILFIIAYYERQTKRTQSSTFSETVAVTAERLVDTLPRQLKRMSFFEGFFVGRSSDIDVIFDLEEEISNNNINAIGMDEVERTPQKGADPSRYQRAPQGPFRQPSVQNSRPLNVPSPSKDSSKDAATSPQASTGVRKRLTSAMQRSGDQVASFVSPLAQIYQPLVVDDDILEEEGGSPSSIPPLVSFGPSMRRRLSSMHRFPPMGTTELQKKMDRDKHSGGVNDAVANRSTELMQSDVEDDETHEAQPEPVSQVEEEEGSSGSIPQMAQRLMRMEERQRRLEALILQLSRDLKLRSDN